MSKPRTLLSDLEELIVEFEALQHRLGGRTDMPSNYLQTTAICTLVGMMGVANSLIRGADDIPTHEKRTHYFTAKAEFTIRQLYLTQYKAFFVELLNSIELAFANLCQENNWEVKSITKDNERKSIESLERKLPRLEGDALEAFNNYKKKIIEKEVKFTFNDYFSRVLKNCGLNEVEKSKWEKFFTALASVLRNKAAHSDPSISVKEKDRLIEAGLDYVIWGDFLGLDSRALIRVANTVDEFFIMLHTKGLSKNHPELGWITLEASITPDDEGDLNP